MEIWIWYDKTERLRTRNSDAEHNTSESLSHIMCVPSYEYESASASAGPVNERVSFLFILFFEWNVKRVLLLLLLLCTYDSVLLLYDSFTWTPSCDCYTLQQ